MLLPRLLIIIQIPRKRLLAPRSLARIRNRRKRNNAFIYPRILQKQRQSSVAAHTMSRNRNARAIQLSERREECIGEFGRDVGFHFVVLGPGRGGCVDVEAGAGAEIA